MNVKKIPKKWTFICVKKWINWFATKVLSVYETSTQNINKTPLATELIFLIGYPVHGKFDFFVCDASSGVVWPAALPLAPETNVRSEVPVIDFLSSFYPATVAGVPRADYFITAPFLLEKSNLICKMCVVCDVMVATWITVQCLSIVTQHTFCMRYRFFYYMCGWFVVRLCAPPHSGDMEDDCASDSGLKKNCPAYWKSHLFRAYNRLKQYARRWNTHHMQSKCRSSFAANINDQQQRRWRPPDDS